MHYFLFIVSLASCTAVKVIFRPEEQRTICLWNVFSSPHPERVDTPGEHLMIQMWQFWLHDDGKNIRSLCLHLDHLETG